MPSKKTKSSSTASKKAPAKRAAPNGSAKPATKDALAISAAKTPVAAVAAKPTPFQLRVKIGDAMRSLGLDEPRLARLFRSLLRRLNKPKSEKLLLEAVKETCRLLEAYPASRPASAGPGNASPIIPIQFITVVPRPEREAVALAAPLEDASAPPEPSATSAVSQP
jgi:hypothetical protein